MSRYHRPVTPEQKAKAAEGRDKKLQELHQQLEKQVAALRTGEDWQRWLSFAARFHEYSFQNTLLIAAQHPDATAVAGYEAWKQLGRQVDKGQRGIAILAPIVRRPKDDDTETQPRIAGFRPTYVWDAAQTSGAPLPEQPAAELLKGQAPAGLWDAVADLVDQAGYQLERGPCGTANGITNSLTHVVRVREDLDDAQAVKTLAHELGHVRLHCNTDDHAEVPCRGLAEVEAESVAYLVAASHGLEAGAYSFPYVTSWAGNVQGVTPEQAVRQTGQRVMSAARWMLDATDMLDADRAAFAERLATRLDAATRTSASLRVRAEATRVRADIARPVQRPSVPPREVSRGELIDLHRTAAAFFQAQVAGSWVPGYLAGRGLDVAIGEPWCAGWAPSGWTTLVGHLRGLGADDAALLASGLASPARTGSLINRFRDRLMIPLRDGAGDVVAFIGRAHPDADTGRAPKYLNSPQTPIYSKGELLFGLPETRIRLDRGAMPVLVEGPLDAIAVTAGTGGRCAGLSACGTALTEAHVQRLAEVVTLRSRGVVVATDADAAGRAAAERALQLLTPYGVSAQVAGLPAGGDPAELYAKAGGAELTAALLDRGRPLVDAVIDRRMDAFQRPLRWLEDRVGVLRDVAPLVASLPIDDVRRQVGRLARQLDLDVTTVQREIASHIGLPARRSTHRASQRAPAAPLTLPRSAVPAPVGPRRSHR